MSKTPESGPPTEVSVSPAESENPRPAMPGQPDGSLRESDTDMPDEAALLKLMEESEKPPQTPRTEGDSTLSGVVVNVRDDGCFVDIGRKSEAFLPKEAATDVDGQAELQAGDEIEVSITGRSPDGYLTLSRVIAERPKNWAQFEAAYENGIAIAGKVTEVIKGGLAVDVGVRAFMPASRTGVRDSSELEKLVGEEIRCRIVQLDVADENVIVDRRVLLEEEQERRRQERLATLEPGMVVEGKVSDIRDFGAFIDLGGVDGLLHVSDLAWERIKDVSSVLSVGDPVEVKVLKIEEGGNRISVGRKQLTPDPWTLIGEKLNVGDRLRGTVKRLTDFGAFVEIEPGVEGLVHVSEMSWARRVRHPKDLLKLGDVVDVVVLEMNPSERRIGLGIKQALGDPWENAEQKFPVGKVLEGRVRNLAKFGAFVEVEEGVEGLLHISDIVSDRRLNHPSEILKTDQTVQVAIVGVDPEKRRLKLSMKDLEPDDQDLFIEDHNPGDTVTGRVADVRNGKAIVDLGEGVRATCHLDQTADDATPADSASGGAKDVNSLGAMLASAWKGDSDAGRGQSGRSEKLQPGQVRSFRITRLDSENRSVELALE